MPEKSLCYEHYVHPSEFDHTTQPEREALCAAINNVNTYRQIFPILAKHGLPVVHSLTDAELDEVLMNCSLLDRHNIRRAKSAHYLFETVCSVTLLDPAALCVLRSDPPDYLRLLASLCFKEDSMLHMGGLVISTIFRNRVNQLMNKTLTALATDDRVWYIESYDRQLVVYLTGSIADASDVVFQHFTKDAMLLVTEYENLYLNDKGVPYPFAPDGTSYRRSGMVSAEREGVDVEILSTLRLRKLNLLL